MQNMQWDGRVLWRYGFKQKFSAIATEIADRQSLQQEPPAFLKLRPASWVPINAKANSLTYISEINILLKLSLMMLLSMEQITYIYVKILIMLILLSEQARGRPTWSVRTIWWPRTPCWWPLLYNNASTRSRSLLPHVLQHAEEVEPYEFKQTNLIDFSLHRLQRYALLSRGVNCQGRKRVCLLKKVICTWCGQLLSSNRKNDALIPQSSAWTVVIHCISKCKSGA